MKLCDLSIWDKKLLRLNVLGRETMNIRIHTHQDVVLCSKTVVGGVSSVSSLEQMSCLLGELITKVRKKQLLIKWIEVAHTHRSHKLKLNEFIVGELSSRDQECAVYLKKHYCFPLAMRVVSNLGFAMYKFI